MPNYSEVYLYTDQPTTCPICGARTGIILDLGHTVAATQVHICLNATCKEEFVVQDSQ